MPWHPLDRSVPKPGPDYVEGGAGPLNILSYSSDEYPFCQVGLPVVEPGAGELEKRCTRRDRCRSVSMVRPIPPALRALRAGVDSRPFFVP